MKRVLLSAVQLCAVAVITNAQIINGDRNHNARLDVQDITMLISDYTTGNQEIISGNTANGDGTPVKVTMPVTIPERTVSIDTILRIEEKWLQVRVPVEIPDQMIQTDDQDVTIEVGGQLVSFVVPGQRIVLPAQMVEAETDVYIRGEEIRFFIGRTIPAQHITTTIKMEATEEPTPSTPGAVVFNTETGSGQTR